MEKNGNIDILMRNLSESSEKNEEAVGTKCNMCNEVSR